MVPHSLKPIKKGGDGGDSVAAALKVAVKGPEPPLNVRAWPKPDHVAPFQPSPHESVIVRAHMAPSGMERGAGKEANGAPPERLPPPLHVSDQLTSPGQVPAVTDTYPTIIGGGVT